MTIGTPSAMSASPPTGPDDPPEEWMHPDEARSLIARLMAAESETKRLRTLLRDIAPFALEDYYPACATTAYQSAAEAMIEYLRESKPGAAS